MQGYPLGSFHKQGPNKVSLIWGNPKCRVSLQDAEDLDAVFGGAGIIALEPAQARFVKTLGFQVYGLGTTVPPNMAHLKNQLNLGDIRIRGYKYRYKYKQHTTLIQCQNDPCF